MSTGLGYAVGQAHRQTVRNNSASVNILKGQVVKIITPFIQSSGIGDTIHLVELADDAENDTAVFGIADSDIKATGVAGEGEFGHVVTYGLTFVRANADIGVGKAINAFSNGNVTLASAAEVTAGQAIGRAYQTITVATNPLGLAFVNLENRWHAASGFGDAGT